MGQPDILRRGHTNSAGRSLARWSPLLLLVPLVVILLQTAWMSDDAYITLRTVDNWINGRGLTWNAGERVQAYTHPLWMLLLSAGYFITRDGYYATLAISMALTVATMVLLVRISFSPSAAVFAIASLTVSRAFIDYSTSGLENALTHFLLALFLMLYLQEKKGEIRLWALTFILCLVALNRLDQVVLLLPAFGLILYEYRGLISRQPAWSLGLLALGLMPLVAWELFSLLYYGMPFPNTFYAKLMSGVPQRELTRRGAIYLLQSSRMDPLIPVLILGGFFTAIWTRRAKLMAIAFGIVLYLAYVVAIGGDFMGGRFLTAPLFCSVVIIAVSPLVRSLARMAIPLMVLLVVGLTSPYSPLKRSLPGCDLVPAGTDVTDERSCWFDGTGLRNQTPEADITPNHPLSDYGRAVRDDLMRVHVMGAIGMFGYYAGPDKYIVDLNALTSPLLSKLPVPAGKPWRIGHFERLIPAGYLETLVSGQNRLCDGNLAQYYDRLALITRGPLFDPKRLEIIVRMNLGQYDHLIDAYGAEGDPDKQLCNADHKTGVQFVTGPRLAGYSISPAQPKPGDLLSLALYFQGRPEGRDKGVASIVRVREDRVDAHSNLEEGSTVWVEDLNNDPGGRFTSDYWRHHVYVDFHALRLPDDMSSGKHFIEIAFFDPHVGEQLAVAPESVAPPQLPLARSLWLAPIRLE